MKHSLPYLALLALSSTAVLWADDPAAAGPGRNIVLVVSDDHSLDLGCYGNPVIQTPHLDALAADGIRFTYAFCTTASCSASRSVILSGLHNHANGQYGHQHHFHKFSSYDNLLTLPVYLSQAGYRTARAGKYHVAPEAVYRFETVIPGPARNGHVMAENCRDFLNADSDRPFFLYFCLSDPHRGGGTADELPHGPDRFGNPAPGRSFAGITEVVYDPDDVIVPGFLPDTPTSRAELAQYYQSVSRLDQGVGRLMEVLQEAGVWDQTLMIYISDHGIAMPGAKTTLYEGGMRSPLLVRNPYSDLRGAVRDAMISWVDLTPTILDFAGLLDSQTGRVREEVVDAIPPNRARTDPQNTRDVTPGQFHGRSFLPLLDAPGSDGWDTVYASHTFHEIQMYYPMRVVRQRRWKLIWNLAYPLPFPFASDLWAAPTWQVQYQQGMDAPFGPWTVGRYIQRPEFELFDLEQDPYEANNLAEDPEYAEVREAMIEQLQEFQRRTDDPWILKWEYD